MTYAFDPRAYDLPTTGFDSWHSYGQNPRDATTINVGAAALPKPYRITFCLNLYKRQADRPLAHSAVNHLLRALTYIDCEYLRAHPETPNLYTSGVRYEEEPPGQEDWQDIPTTLELGYGDCEDLCCWRAAELRVRSGIDAWPTKVWRHRPNGGLLYHIQVVYPDKRVEDPSRRLGMR